MKDKVALITGAASGIGAATAIAIAREGAAVMVCDMDRDKGRQTVELISAAGGRACYCYLDVTEPDSHYSSVAEIKRLFGGLDVAVNCAGVSVGPSKVQLPIHETELRDWRHVIDVNLNGVFYGMRAQIPQMIERGGGSIVNVGSINSVVGRLRLSPYVASKHAVLGLTKAAAIDCAVHRIRVNAVGPGYVDTPMQASRDAETRQSYERLHPLNRFARADEIAEAIVWLCSDKSSFTTGAFHAVDGGYTAQ